MSEILRELKNRLIWVKYFGYGEICCDLDGKSYNFSPRFRVKRIPLRAYNLLIASCNEEAEYLVLISGKEADEHEKELKRKEDDKKKKEADSVKVTPFVNEIQDMINLGNCSDANKAIKKIKKKFPDFDFDFLVKASDAKKEELELNEQVNDDFSAQGIGSDEFPPNVEEEDVSGDDCDDSGNNDSN